MSTSSHEYMLCGCAACMSSQSSAGGGVGGSKQSFTATQAADQITRGGTGWVGLVGNPGQTVTTLTYSFLNSATGIHYADTQASGGANLSDAFTSASGFMSFSLSQIRATETALALWSDLANVNFTRQGGTVGSVGYSTAGDIRFGGLAGGTSYAFAYLPFQNSAGGGAAEASGDVWFDLTETTLRNLNVGGYGFQTMMHEIGHALGLRHPGNYNGSATFGADAVYAQDTQQYSLMSYFDESFSGAQHYSVNATTPLLHDIAAIQSIYGANMSTRVGNTTYGFNSNADRDVFKFTSANQKSVFAVWDAGGFDTLDLSGYAQNQLINIAAGGFSNAGGLLGNIAIAENVIMEAAIGGSGDDTIFGNEHANVLSANDGFDVVNGLGGADTIDGGTGDDTINGGTGDDSIDGGFDWDQLSGDEGNDYLIGNSGFDTLWGGLGEDQLVGGAGNDLLDGGAGVDTAIFGGVRSDYTLSRNGDVFVVTDMRTGDFDGIDRLVSVERLRFQDVTVSIDTFLPAAMDGDMFSDIVWTSLGGGAAAYLMNGTSIRDAVAIGGANGTGWRVAATGDLDGDGDSDLVWQHESGFVSVYTMEDGKLADARLVANSSAAFRVAGVGDLNGDGNGDIVLNDARGQAVGWLMNGDALLGAAVIGGANGAGWNIGALGDLNGDGRDDIIWTQEDGRAAAFLMNGLSVASAALLNAPSATGFRAVGAGDMNGDGRADIVWQTAGGQAAVSLMNGLAIQSSALVGGANGQGYQVRDVADINGDGRMDIIWQDVSAGRAMGYLMDGQQLLGSSHIGPANGADWMIV